MCSPASFETAYVQRASPTEPIVETWPSSTRNACVPKTSLVEKSTKRSSVSSVRAPPRARCRCRSRSRASSAPGSRARCRRRRSRRSGRCASRPRELVHALRVEHVRLVEREVRVLGERRAGERVAVQVVDGDDLVLVDEPAGERRADEAGAAGDEDPLALRATRRVYRRATVSPGMRTALLIAVAARRRRLRRAPGAAGSTPTTELTISVLAAGPRRPSAPERWTLRCGPAGGTLPRARRRVPPAARDDDAVRTPQRKNLVCTDQYGGPQQAVIAGTHRGSRVWVAARDAERLRDRARRHGSRSSCRASPPVPIREREPSR